MNTLLFATNNNYKYSEYCRIFKLHNVELIQVELRSVDEIQTMELELITRDKLIKAYQIIKRPILVDHSSIYMEALNGLPQGLNNIYWGRLIDKVCEVAKSMKINLAKIGTCIGVCDGQKIICSEFKKDGFVSELPDDGDFNLDRIFIPNGCDRTLAAMSKEERDINGYRKEAVSQLMLKINEDLATKKRLGFK